MKPYDEFSSNLSIFAPFYLENSGNQWILQGKCEEELIAIRFDHFDAKIWQQFNELFIDSSRSLDNLSIELSGLKQMDLTNTNATNTIPDAISNANNNTNTFIFISNSSIHTISELSSGITVGRGHKCLNWDNLVSSRAVIYGIYQITGTLETVLCSKSEESLGNLSLIPPSIPEGPMIILRDPGNPSNFVYPDKIEIGNGILLGGPRKFLINVRTIYVYLSSSIMLIFNFGYKGFGINFSTRIELHFIFEGPFGYPGINVKDRFGHFK